jgi:hypothetical protein
VIALETAWLGAPDAAGAPDGQATVAAEATIRVPAAVMRISLFCFRLMIR